MTEKQNFMMVARGEMPEWIPRYLVPSPGKKPAYVWVRPSFLEANRTPEGGFDIWGVEYVATKETGGMALPVPGKFILDDITKWRDIIRVPDFGEVDWETMAKKDLANIDRNETAIGGGVHVGYFQQLMNFMGFTEGLCTLYDDPEEVLALYDYMSAFYTGVVKNYLHYYKPDVFGITDDTATAQNPFISVDMYRTLVKPYHTKEASLAMELGLPVDMHDCGRCEDFIEDWLDFGVCMWNPAQTMNDLKGIKEKYGRKLALIGCWDSSGPVAWPGATEEMVKEAVRECIDQYAPDGGFVFWASTYGAADDIEMQNKKRWIQEEYDSYGRTFYDK